MSAPVGSTVRETVEQLCEELVGLHAQLTRNELVVWTAGNVSARVPGEELLVIKPSGVPYEALTAQTMVVTDFDGRLIEGGRQPSSDTAAHAYVYRHLPGVAGVVHTHSTYATAWCARREPIPCVLTMMADEFGGDIPVGPFALIGDDSIGRGIVQALTGSRSTAVLMGGARPVHYRAHRQGGGQVRRDARGRRPHRPHRPAARQPPPPRPGRHRQPLPALPERVWTEGPGVTARSTGYDLLDLYPFGNAPLALLHRPGSCAGRPTDASPDPVSERGHPRQQPYTADCDRTGL